MFNPSVKYKLEKYKTNNGKVYNYLLYKYISDKKGTCEEFNNMEFFIIDTKSDVFRDITKNAGGFLADTTTRFFKDNNLDVSYLMLAAIPQKTNTFFFNLLYLNNTGEILKRLNFNNYTVYSYFKKRFENCVVSKGSVFDLLNDSRFEILKEYISYETSVDFDLIIEGRPITDKDILILQNKDFELKDWLKEILEERGIEIDHLEFKINYGGSTFVDFKGVMVDKNGETIKEFQVDPQYAENGVNTKEEYRKYIKEKIDINLKDDEIKDYCIHEPLEFVKMNSSKFTYKIMDKTQQKKKEYNNIEFNISNNQDIER